MPNDLTAEKIEALGKEIVSLGGEARLRALLRLMEVRMEEPDYKVRCRSAGPWRLSCPRVQNPKWKIYDETHAITGKGAVQSLQWGWRGAVDVGAAGPQPPPRIFACPGDAKQTKPLSP